MGNEIFSKTTTQKIIMEPEKKQESKQWMELA